MKINWKPSLFSTPGRAHCFTLPHEGNQSVTCSCPYLPVEGREKSAETPNEVLSHLVL